ncbi:hypothetical protein C8F04DRAFT_1181805 [Mycena alexandri]|uniref:Uncharacterized protein n=1 Tax=Mycena alexandri TaxID=1745969 RepID=A0AAD6SYY3_9AGAR|nr:hypothetical protein C8F04DRAFT_1181805 [Mycena alexandri]
MMELDGKMVKNANIGSKLKRTSESLSLFSASTEGNKMDSSRFWRREKRFIPTPSDLHPEKVRVTARLDCEFRRRVAHNGADPGGSNGEYHSGFAAIGSLVRAIDTREGRYAGSGKYMRLQLSHLEVARVLTRVRDWVRTGWWVLAAGDGVTERFTLGTPPPSATAANERLTLVVVVVVRNKPEWRVTTFVTTLVTRQFFKLIQNRRRDSYSSFGRKYTRHLPARTHALDDRLYFSPVKKDKLTGIEGKVTKLPWIDSEPPLAPPKN